LFSPGSHAAISCAMQHQEFSRCIHSTNGASRHGSATHKIASRRSNPASLSPATPGRRKTLNRSALVILTCVICLSVSSACAQQFDAAFGISGLKAPSASEPQIGFHHAPQSVGGGVFPVFSADFLFKKQFGFGGEVFWRATRNLYQAFGANQPFRPVFYDFNAVWAPRLGKRAAAQVEGGIGSQSARFYQPFVTCNFVSCTNFVSSNHLLGHVGGGVKLYVWHSVFLRPEAHFYFVHNNLEFSGLNATRLGVSVGYTWSPQY